MSRSGNLERSVSAISLPHQRLLIFRGNANYVSMSVPGGGLPTSAFSAKRQPSEVYRSYDGALRKSPLDQSGTARNQKELWSLSFGSAIGLHPFLAIVCSRSRSIALLKQRSIKAGIWQCFRFRPASPSSTDATCYRQPGHSPASILTDLSFAEGSPLAIRRRSATRFRGPRRQDE
jgi:hypothetical protein